MDAAGACGPGEDPALAGAPAELPKPAVGEAVLATWHLLLDEGRCRRTSRSWPAPASPPRST